MRHRHLILVILFLGVSTGRATDIHCKAGSKGLSFLKVGLGARAAALGGAYVAAADDATGPLWNPAGLTAVDGPELVFVHSQWFQDVRSEFVGGAVKNGENGFGFGFLMSTVGEIEQRAPETGKLIGTFSAYDIALSGAYARKVRDEVSLGLTLKVLYEKMYVYSSSGIALDLGVRIAPGIDDLSVGAVLQNIGRMGAMRDEETPLPFTAKAGVAYCVGAESLKGTLLLTADISKASDYWTTVHTGLEYRLDRRLALRGGCSFGQDERSFSAGIGLAFNIYRLDYAYAPFDLDLGDTHRVGFSISL